MPDSLRLALGTLTVLRVPPPRRVDARVARGAMLLAPVVGLLVALCGVVVLDLVRVFTGVGASHTAVDLLGSALALTSIALVTRGLHLDGLADTADALGVKGDDDEVVTRRLAVMRGPEVGAFGVAAVLFTVLLQLAALTTCATEGYGTASLLVSVVTARLAVTWACTTRVPSARPDGLGAAVAGTVPVAAAAVVTVVVLAGAAALGMLDDDRSVHAVLVLVAASVVGLLAGALVVRRCVRRLGGITGDVLGATVELTTAAVLVVVALAL